MIEWSKVFAESLPYRDFLDRHANPSQRERWDAMHGAVCTHSRTAGSAEDVHAPDAGDLSHRCLVR